MSELGLENLEHLKDKILEKTRFKYICLYHGEKSKKDCLRESVQEVIGISDSAFCSVFGIYIEDYVNELYKSVEE